jgi:RimJ/RimL family protein N-acetyltransferase
VRIRHVVAGEHERLRALRLASLATDPAAFASTHEREAALPSEQWEQWAALSDEGAAQRTFVLVADDDRWVGLALARLDDERTGGAMLNAMWVAPEARGRGAARLLCDACAGWAAAHGCDEIELDVVVGNDTARRAYEAAGFAVRGSRQLKRDGRTRDQLVMVRPLPRG